GDSGAKSKEKRVAAKGFRLPDSIQAGEVLTDMNNKQWKMGRRIGTGGFGVIYLASDDIGREVDDSAQHCVKIEPHSNGPLFTEMHCYMRIAKNEDIENWMLQRNREQIGMPRFIGAGSHIYKDVKYRFLIMQRFGVDFQKVLKKYKRLSLKTIYQVGIQVIDVLEYIHSKEFVHGDIKAANLLIGHHGGTLDQVFLVDFGLASHYAFDGRHKEYKYDGRRAHYGTIEFTSRDAHIGTYSRRGDIEVLVFNMAKWLCGVLPWEDDLEDWDYVATQKRNCIEDIPDFMKQCFGDLPVRGIQELLEYTASLAFDEPPDYNKCRDIMRRDLISNGYLDDDELIIMPLSLSNSNTKFRPYNNNLEKLIKNSANKEHLSVPQNNSDRQKLKACRLTPGDVRSTRVTRLTRALSQNEPELLTEHSLSNAYFDDSPMLDDEEIMIIKEQKKIEERRFNLKAVKIEIKRDASLDNPTPQMIEIMNKIYEKGLLPPPCTKRHKHSNTCVIVNINYDDEPPSNLTAEMEAVMRRMSERKQDVLGNYNIQRQGYEESSEIGKSKKSSFENVSPVSELDFQGFSEEEQARYNIFLDDCVGEEFSGFTEAEQTHFKELNVARCKDIKRFQNFSEALQRQLDYIEQNNVEFSSTPKIKSKVFSNKTKSKNLTGPALNPRLLNRNLRTRVKTQNYSNLTNNSYADNKQSNEDLTNQSPRCQEDFSDEEASDNEHISGYQVRSHHRTSYNMQFSHSDDNDIEYRGTLCQQTKRDLLKRSVHQNYIRKPEYEYGLHREKMTPENFLCQAVDSPREGLNHSTNSPENVMSFMGRRTRSNSQYKYENHSQDHREYVELLNSSGEHLECEATPDNQPRRSGRKLSTTPCYIFESDDEDEKVNNQERNMYRSRSVTPEIKHEFNNDSSCCYSVSDEESAHSVTTGNKMINVSIDNLDSSLEFLPHTIRLTRRMVREVMGE
ncbi:unnamed protein product, partial [Meganyctiphanes norvegica]